MGIGGITQNDNFNQKHSRNSSEKKIIYQYYIEIFIFNSLKFEIEYSKLIIIILAFFFLL